MVVRIKRLIVKATRASAERGERGGRTPGREKYGRSGEVGRGWLCKGQGGEWNRGRSEVRRWQRGGGSN